MYIYVYNCQNKYFVCNVSRERGKARRMCLCKDNEAILARNTTKTNKKKRNEQLQQKKKKNMAMAKKIK